MRPTWIGGRADKMRPKPGFLRSADRALQRARPALLLVLSNVHAL